MWKLEHMNWDMDTVCQNFRNRGSSTDTNAHKYPRVNCHFSGARKQSQLTCFVTPPMTDSGNHSQVLLTSTINYHTQVLLISTITARYCLPHPGITYLNYHTQLLFTSTITSRYYLPQLSTITPRYYLPQLSTITPRYYLSQLSTITPRYYVPHPGTTYLNYQLSHPGTTYLNYQLSHPGTTYITQVLLTSTITPRYYLPHPGTAYLNYHTQVLLTSPRYYLPHPGQHLNCSATAASYSPKLWILVYFFQIMEVSNCVSFLRLRKAVLANLHAPERER